MKITAHSGCEGTPDNSLEFVEYALTAGVDAFEIDIRKVDGELIISHDVPTDDSRVYLKDVFELANTKSEIGINCDLKDAGIELEVLNLAKNYNNPIMFSGTVALDKVKEIETQNSTTYLNVECIIDGFYDDKDKNNHIEIKDDELQKIISTMTGLGATTLNIHFNAYTKELETQLAKHNIQMSLWTPNTTEQLAPLMKANVRNITTSYPKLVAQFV
ncbi:MAG: hypothetical protein ATN35_13170 [Epulopiscium sp. Nele67-Bin004]|nr:MAG: hypothetical protein ATN35_13170 [Epulopiscium sp. Nele67-Bin004]